MRRPQPRGPLSAGLLADLPSGTVSDATSTCAQALAQRTGDALADEDLQLALTLLYELHYTGVEGVPDDAELDPAVLGVTRTLERAVERDLRALVASLPVSRVADDGGPIDLLLEAVIDADDGPSVSRYLCRSGTPEEWREFLAQKSLYHLKEADPHTWVIPRVRAAAKAALVEIQADEYGGGSAVRMHSALFARMMREMGLDDTYGAHVDVTTASGLAAANLMTFFGFSRRWRGAAIGHLSGVEMTSTEPCRRLAAGLKRLGASAAATLYYEEHVEADAVHEQLASKDLCGALVAAEPELRADVLFGTAAYLAVEARFGTGLLEAWEDGRSALYGSEAEAAA